MILGLEKLGPDEFMRLDEALHRRMQALGASDPRRENRELPVSGVIEYRPHADSTLQAEIRRYCRKDGRAKEQGPYWYFSYSEGGKQKKIYLGRTDDPEDEIVRNRSASPRDAD
jgi:hypothetical protein